MGFRFNGVGVRGEEVRVLGLGFKVYLQDPMAEFSGKWLTFPKT